MLDHWMSGCPVAGSTPLARLDNLRHPQVRYWLRPLLLCFWCWCRQEPGSLSWCTHDYCLRNESVYQVLTQWNAILFQLFYGSTMDKVMHSVYCFFFPNVPSLGARRARSWLTCKTVMYNHTNRSAILIPKLILCRRKIRLDIGNQFVTSGSNN
jgi:hypothetical protein